MVTPSRLGGNPRPGQTGGMTSAAFDLAAIGAGLSFASAIDGLRAALDTSTSVVVSAPPGTGKTTLVPPLLASRSSGRVIVTQPRRVAARAAARRLAQLDGSPLGTRVGFTVRGERAVGRETRVEFVTAGVLLRRLLDDPGLEGVDAVIIDEVHERAIETDLLIGLLSEVRQLRDDLVLLAMSATLDAARIAAVIGSDDAPAPVVAHDVPAFPLTERWAPSPAPRLDDRGVTRAFLDHVARTTASSALDLRRDDSAADVLVFAPGAREVSEVARRLRDTTDGFDVRELHGRMSTAEQDAVIRGRRPGDPTRIIVATSLAESSLTVPGVRLVVDTCLARMPQRDAARGMTGLVTAAASRSSCVQRAGRATRQGPGTVVRCIDERTYAAAPARPTPEIASTDLADATLLLACWGAPGGSGLRLIDPLPTDNLADALRVLHDLGAIDDEGRATPTGRDLARIPTDPRLARALRDGSPVMGARLAAEVVALLGGEVRTADSDVAQALVALRSGGSHESRRWRSEADRLERMTTPAPGVRSDLDGVGFVIALAFPERIARRVDRTADGATFLLASGTRAGVSGPLAAVEWLAIADVTRAGGRAAAGSGAVVRSAAVLTEGQMERAAGPCSPTASRRSSSGAACRRVASAGWARSSAPRRRCARPRRRGGMRCAAPCSARGSGFSPGRQRPSNCETVWLCCTARRAPPGRTCRTRRSSRRSTLGWRPRSMLSRAAPPPLGSTWPQRSDDCCPGLRRVASTSSCPSDSRYLAARASASPTRRPMSRMRGPSSP